VKAVVVLVLAGVAGLVDAAGYLLLGGVFVAHVTGNSSHIGQRLGVGDLHAALPAIAMIGLFVASIAVVTAVIDRTGRRMPALALESALLAALAASPAAFWLQLALAVCAMGAQTAAVTKLGDRTVRTTYLSGMATRLGQGLVRGDPRGIVLYTALVVCFVGGATAGAYGFTQLHFAVFAFGAAAVAVVSVVG
jgi:uncharacterized membrane protein YoaK (UPF0700 family)